LLSQNQQRNAASHGRMDEKSLVATTYNIEVKLDKFDSLQRKKTKSFGKLSSSFY
jgi:hypothetical protein